MPGLKVVNYFGSVIVIAYNIGSRGRTTHSKSGFGSIIYKLKVFLEATAAVEPTVYVCRYTAL